MKKTEKSKNQNIIYPEKKPKKVREKINWKPWLVVGAVILVIMGGIFTKVCIIDGYFKLAAQTPMDRVQGGYVDNKNNITYTAAPTYYQPASVVLDPPYARIGDFSLLDMSKWDELDHLYRVGYPSDPTSAGSKTILTKSEAWLATDAAHGSILFYNAALFDLPTPDKLKVESVYLCNDAIATQLLDDASGKKVMSDFFSADAENLYDRMETYNAKYIKTLRVTSSNYPWIHFVLSLYQAGDDYFLFLPEEQKFVMTDRDIFDIYFKAIEEETDVNSPKTEVDGD